MSEKVNTKSLDNFDRALTCIKDYVAPLKGKSKEDILERVGRQEGAKLNTALAYSLCSLFYMYLKTQGVNVRNHPVRGQLVRVQEYFKKLKNVTEGKPVDYIGMRKMKVDQTAARRFVIAGLQQNPEMKQRNGLPPSEGVHTRFEDEEDSSEEEDNSIDEGQGRGEGYAPYENPTNISGTSSNDIHENNLAKRKSPDMMEYEGQSEDSQAHDEGSAKKKICIQSAQTEACVPSNAYEVEQNQSGCEEQPAAITNQYQPVQSLEESNTRSKKKNRRRNRKGKGASDFFWTIVGYVFILKNQE